MSRKCDHDWLDHYMHTHFGPQLTFLTFIMGVLFDMESGSRGMRLPLTAQNSAIKRCPQCRRPCIIWQHVTFCSRYTFLMVSNPDRIAPGRRLPESTQSTLHHYFIRSHADINAYLLIIDKLLLIRYQATVKQSTLFFADGS